MYYLWECVTVYEGIHLEYQELFCQIKQLLCQREIDFYWDVTAKCGRFSRVREESSLRQSRNQRWIIGIGNIHVYIEFIHYNSIYYSINYLHEDHFIRVFFACYYISLNTMNLEPTSATQIKGHKHKGSKYPPTDRWRCWSLFNFPI